MNGILLTGTALLTLINAGMTAIASPKHATQYQQAPLQQQAFGAGAWIDAVDRNSPAARAGILPGDRIVGVNGSPIDGIADVIPFVAGGGRPIAIDIERGGTHMRVWAFPPNGRWQRGALGITGTEFGFGVGQGDDAPVIFDPNTIPPIPPPPPDPPPLPPITN